VITGKKKKMYIYDSENRAVEQSKIQKIVVPEVGQQNEERGGTNFLMDDNLPTLQYYRYSYRLLYG